MGLISFSILYSIHVSISSGVNTPPASRNSWSAARASSESRSEFGTWGMFLASSGGSSYRSLSTGSCGSMRFLMPSSPAIICAAKARYGLPEASGARNSMRLAFGFEPVIGMRMAAERLPAE